MMSYASTATPIVRPAVLQQAYALGPAGRPGGVDQGGQVLGLDGGDHLLHRLGVGQQVVGALLPQVGPADHLGVVGAALDLHDGDQGGQVVQVVEDLGHLAVVLGEDDLGLGVGQDERDVLVGGGRVDRGRRSAGAHHGQVGQDPLDPGVAGDRHPLLATDAQREQAGRELVDLVLGLRPGQRDPALALQVAEGLFGRAGGDLLEQHRPYRCRPRCQQCCVGHTREVSPTYPLQGWNRFLRLVAAPARSPSPGRRRRTSSPGRTRRPGRASR